MRIGYHPGLLAQVDLENPDKTILVVVVCDKG
jgi:hypothetical protein